MLVAVGSSSKVKFNATLRAAKRLRLRCRVKPMDVKSGVRRQPIGAEALAGARNRARRALRSAEADLGVGIEGGLLQLLGSYYIGAFCCVVDRKGVESLSTTPLVRAPSGLVRRLKAGEELGDVMDELTSTAGTKHGPGAVGLMTGRKLTRTHAYEDAVVLALSRFVRPKIFEQLERL
jgi:inosine/xanthosine triphosphatase